ncbi:MAG: 3-phosphoshikimate 1-carboxyvinyltransferase [Eubacterium sp.]|nr:3-phosphoshikimate 1-carboxyvinyltransferase [Eubacterium sp.]
MISEVIDNKIQIDIDRARFGGSIKAIASKSHAHRLLIAAALSDEPELFIECSESSQDIEATASCLNSLGAEIVRVENGYKVKPISQGNSPKTAVDSTASGSLESDTVSKNSISCMDAGESGSTLRFLLPIIGVLGVSAEITTHGRLSARPLSPLYEEMQRSGVTLSPQGSNPLTLSGRMDGGVFTIAGNISSQYITGLLFALPLAEKDSEIRVTGELASRPYIDITLDVLRQAGIVIEEVYPDNAVPTLTDASSSSTDINTQSLDGASDISVIFRIKGAQKYRLPSHCTVEGDWSNAAFFLTAGAVGQNPVTVRQLNMNSKQGDMKILELLSQFGAKIDISQSALSDVTVTPAPLHGIEIDAENIPDLVPILSLTASVAEGTTIIRNIERLRIKESDRVATVIDTLTRLGADVCEEDRCLKITGKASLEGGSVDSYNDHRIAMTAAIAAICSEGTVEIETPMAVRKSYPGFYEDLAKLSE